MSPRSSLPVSLALDCGATNIRAIAIDSKGRILHREALPNAAVQQYKDRPWLIWDHEDIWNKLVLCIKKTAGLIGKDRIVSLAVTSFSDDGAPVDRNGRPVYPVISWQCGRTRRETDELKKLIRPEEIYKISGQGPFPQHTILKLLWLKKYAPGALEKAYKYLMFPGMIVHRLTGEFTNDPTTADSMMLLDLKKRRYSKKLMDIVGIDEIFFGTLREPGEVAGILNAKAAGETGLRKGTPVIAAGHDTQFAVFGSGCRSGEIILSSGTWEILMLRSSMPRTDRKAYAAGLNNECDPVKGLYDVGLQWIGSGAVEWLSGLLYRENGRSNIYSGMISDAQKVRPGAEGVVIKPSFFSGEGIFGGGGTGAAISGLNLQSDRGMLVRALYEGLSFQLRSAVETIESLMNVTPEILTVVGGGAKNRLWNGIRADITGLPVRLTKQTENTALGAAVFSFIGAGIYKNTAEAINNIDFFGETIMPSSASKTYEGLYEKFKSA